MADATDAARARREKILAAKEKRLKYIFNEVETPKLTKEEEEKEKEKAARAALFSQRSSHDDDDGE